MEGERENVESSRSNVSTPRLIERGGWPLLRSNSLPHSVPLPFRRVYFRDDASLSLARACASPRRFSGNARLFREWFIERVFQFRPSGLASDEPSIVFCRDSVWRGDGVGLIQMFDLAFFSIGYVS